MLYRKKKQIITIDVMIESKNCIQENLYNLMKVSYNLKDFWFNSSSNITSDSKAKVIAFYFQFYLNHQEHFLILFADIKSYI